MNMIMCPQCRHSRLVDWLGMTYPPPHQERCTLCGCLLGNRTEMHRPPYVW